MTQVRFAILLTVPLLAGCAGEQVGLSAAPAPQTAPTGMTGRWFLAAPNAPPCGMSFGGGTARSLARFCRKAAARAASS